MPLVDPSTNRPIDRTPVSPRNSGAPSPRSNTGDTTPKAQVINVAAAVDQATRLTTTHPDSFRRGHRRQDAIAYKAAPIKL